MSKVKSGDTVEIHYRGTLDDGTEFDNSEKTGEPLTFTVGAEEILPAFSEAVVGMTSGETASFKPDHSDAYGPRLDEAVQNIAKTALPEGFPVVVGETVQGTRPDGHQFLAKICEDLGDEIIMDFNHPLAGQNLLFEVTVVSVT